MAEKKFVEGLFFNMPHENAPSFVKGGISVKVEDAITFLKTNKNSAGYVNLDLLESKDGTKWYMALNDYQPPKKVDEPEPEDIPF